MFEYKVVVLDKLNEDALNALGVEGWELLFYVREVGYAARWYFKRVKIDVKAPTWQKQTTEPAAA